MCTALDKDPVGLKSCRKNENVKDLALYIIVQAQGSSIPSSTAEPEPEPLNEVGTALREVETCQNKTAGLYIKSGNAACTMHHLIKDPTTRNMMPS